MSGYPTTLIARDMHRLSIPPESARGTAVSRETICRLVAVEMHFCALIGTKA